MSMRILKAGLQTTIQAAPRIGQRHLGVPASGAADPLSMALANKLVGNALLTASLEITLTGMSFELLADVAIAITGAIASCTVNDVAVQQHARLNLRGGDTVVISPAERGARCYVAFAGGLHADDRLASRSTYLPAGLGGHRGRALQRDDIIKLVQPNHVVEELTTPSAYRLPMQDTWTIRAGCSFETDQLLVAANLFEARLTVGTRSDRTGLKLEGERFDIESEGRMPSAAVFPGTIQCPEDGVPFLLSVDAQTTGGYPRIAQVSRADRHLIGQLRPGNTLRLLLRTDQDAVTELRDKQAYWGGWMPEVRAVF